MASPAKQQQHQQPASTSPLTPTSYRRQSRNVTETSAYGLLENEGGEGVSVPLEHVHRGEEKGKDKAVMYQDGGQEMGGDLGGEELVSEGERERRRRAKGKGRAVESAVEEEDDEVQDGERPEFALDAEEEEAREEQRIAQVCCYLCSGLALLLTSPLPLYRTSPACPKPKQRAASPSASPQRSFCPQLPHSLPFPRRPTSPAAPPLSFVLAQNECHAQCLTGTSKSWKRYRRKSKNLGARAGEVACGWKSAPRHRLPRSTWSIWWKGTNGPLSPQGPRAL